MKKFILIGLVLTVLIIQACKKDAILTDCGEAVDLDLGSRDTFVVSSAGGFGGSGQGTFKIINKALYSVKNGKDSLLPNEKYLTVQSFFTEFPKALKDNFNHEWKNSQCADTYIYSVQLHLSNGSKQSWVYDSCPSNDTPDYVKCYFNKVVKTFFTP